MKIDIALIVVRIRGLPSLSVNVIQQTYCDIVDTVLQIYFILVTILVLIYYFISLQPFLNGNKSIISVCKNKTVEFINTNIAFAFQNHVHISEIVFNKCAISDKSYYFKTLMNNQLIYEKCKHRKGRQLCRYCIASLVSRVRRERVCSVGNKFFFVSLVPVQRQFWAQG